MYHINSLILSLISTLNSNYIIVSSSLSSLSLSSTSTSGFIVGDNWKGITSVLNAFNYFHEGDDDDDDDDDDIGAVECRCMIE
jgi:hypothetical protein